jgi:hypothetical protein
LSSKAKNILFVLGNPGLTGYYEEFVESLHKFVNMPVWIVSHAGHELEKNVTIPKTKGKYYFVL